MPNGTLLNPAINTKENESSITFNAAKDKFNYFRINDLYLSTDKSEPTKEKVSVKGVEQEDLIAIYLTKDAKTRYMVADNFEKKGKGGRDIYISTQNEDGLWTEWSNMESINTEYDEDSPFITEDKKTFYFSSNRPESIGGQDIFVATKTADNKWGSITNMGMPINSTGNDIHFQPDLEGPTSGFLVSDRKKGKGNFDIYRFSTCFDIEKTNIQGRLMAESKPTNGKILLFDTDGNQLSSITAAEGQYTIPVETGKSYKVEVVAKDFLSHNFSFSIPSQCSKYDLYQEIDVTPKQDADGFTTQQEGVLKNGFFNIEKYKEGQSKEAYFASIGSGHRFYSDPSTDVINIDKPIAAIVEKIKFEDVYFDFDKSKVTDKSNDIINKVAKYLKENTTVIVIFKGHTDSKGAANYNKNLSKRRANAVAKIMKSKGIEKNRIEIVALGEAELKIKDTNDNGEYLEEPAKQNRRVEIRLKIKED